MALRAYWIRLYDFLYFFIYFLLDRFCILCYNSGMAESAPRLQKLNDRHYSLMRKIISGMALNEAAREVGYNESKASVIVNDPLFIEEHDKMRGEVNAQFKDFEATTGNHLGVTRIRAEKETMLSLEKLVRLRDNAQTERLQRDCANDILNLAGVSKGEQQEASVTITATAGFVESINELARRREKVVEPIAKPA